jgi:hypothetical protein
LCSEPQAEHAIVAVTAGSWSRLDISMPVETAWPVEGHRIMTTLMIPLLFF